MSSKKLTIAELNAKARRMQKLVKNEEERELARQTRRLATLRKRVNTMSAAHQQIGTKVRTTYLQNNQIARALMSHGGLTPGNARSAAIAFHSPAFRRAAFNKARELQVKIAKYRNLWGAWYKGLPANQRQGMTQNITRVMYGNVQPYALKHTENPLFFVKKGLSTRPARPTNTEGNRRYRHTWKGANSALKALATPGINAILRRYGLPFSMAQARQNLFGARGLTAQTITRLNRNLHYGRGNQRFHNEVPVNMSLGRALGGLPERPPRGLKGYAGKRVRRAYRYRLARALW